MTKYRQRPSKFKYVNLLKSQNFSEILNFSKYIFEAFKLEAKFNQMIGIR